MQVISISDPLPYLPYYVCTYVQFGSAPPILIIHVCSSLYYCLSCVNICGCSSVHTCTFSINIRSLDSLHASIWSRNACTISVNFHARASVSIRTHASVSILDCFPMCMLVRTHASSRIRARSPVSICVRGGCSMLMSVVLSNTILWGHLGHGSRTDHVYIWGVLGDPLYHSLESP